MPETPGTQLPGLDPGFLGRVYKASILLALAAGLILVLYGQVGWAAGVAAAALWSVANIWALARVMTLAVRPGQKDPLKILLALLLKLVVLYGAGALLVIFGGMPPLSLVIGFSVPLLVVVLKALGLILFARGARRPQGGPQA